MSDRRLLPRRQFLRLAGAALLASRRPLRAIVQNGKLLNTQPEDFATDIYADFTLDFAGRHKDKPFCVYMPLHLPHNTAATEGNKIATTPLNGRPGKLTGGTYEECIQYADVVIGRIVDGLRKAKLLHNTIILITSDNGTCGIGKMKATAHGPRVPLVVYGPQYITRRDPFNQLVSLADITPTLLDFARTSPPADYDFDGQSLAPYLQGHTDHHRDSLYSYIGTARMIRDQNWVLEAVDPISSDCPGRLYNTAGHNDPDQYIEVTDNNEPQANAARARLTQKLNEIPHLDPDNPRHQRALEEYRKSPYPHMIK